MEAKKIATFQERFSELIESSSKSRTTIAAEFGVAKQTISAWTTGQTSPRIPVITSLADYFGVSWEWLYGFDVPKYISKSKHEGPPDDPLNDQPLTKESRIISGGIDRMPPEKREQALKILQIAFAEYSDYFKEEPNDDT